MAVVGSVGFEFKPISKALTEELDKTSAGFEKLDRSSDKYAKGERTRQETFSTTARLLGTAGISGGLVLLAKNYGLAAKAGAAFNTHIINNATLMTNLSTQMAKVQVVTAKAVNLFSTTLPNAIKASAPAFTSLKNVVTGLWDVMGKSIEAIPRFQLGLLNLVPGMGKVAVATQNWSAGLQALGMGLTAATGGTSVLGAGLTALGTTAQSAMSLVSSSVTILASSFKRMGTAVKRSNDEAIASFVGYEQTLNTLSASITQYNEVLGENAKLTSTMRGSLSSFEKMIEETSVKTGIMRQQLADGASTMLQFSKFTALSSSQIADLTEKTALFSRVTGNDFSTMIYGIDSFFRGLNRTFAAVGIQIEDTDLKATKIGKTLEGMPDSWTKAQRATANYQAIMERFDLTLQGHEKFLNRTYFGTLNELDVRLNTITDSAGKGAAAIRQFTASMEVSAVKYGQSFFGESNIQAFGAAKEAFGTTASALGTVGSVGSMAVGAYYLKPIVSGMLDVMKNMTLFGASLGGLSRFIGLLIKTAGAGLALSSAAAVFFGYKQKMDAEKDSVEGVQTLGSRFAEAVLGKEKGLKSRVRQKSSGLIQDVSFEYDEDKSRGIKYYDPISARAITQTNNYNALISNRDRFYKTVDSYVESGTSAFPSMFGGTSKVASAVGWGLGGLAKSAYGATHPGLAYLNMRRLANGDLASGGLTYNPSGQAYRDQTRNFPLGEVADALGGVYGNEYAKKDPRNILGYLQGLRHLSNSISAAQADRSTPEAVRLANNMADVGVGGLMTSTETSAQQYEEFLVRYNKAKLSGNKDDIKKAKADLETLGGNSLNESVDSVKLLLEKLGKLTDLPPELAKLVEQLKDSNIGLSLKEIMTQLKTDINNAKDGLTSALLAADGLKGVLRKEAALSGATSPAERRAYIKAARQKIRAGDALSDVLTASESVNETLGGDPRNRSGRRLAEFERGIDNAAFDRSLKYSEDLRGVSAKYGQANPDEAARQAATLTYNKTVDEINDKFAKEANRIIALKGKEDWEKVSQIHKDERERAIKAAIDALNESLVGIINEAKSNVDQWAHQAAVGFSGPKGLEWINDRARQQALGDSAFNLSQARASQLGMRNLGPEGQQRLSIQQAYDASSRQARQTFGNDLQDIEKQLSVKDLSDEDRESLRKLRDYKTQSYNIELEQIKQVKDAALDSIEEQRKGYVDIRQVMEDTTSRSLTELTFGKGKNLKEIWKGVKDDFEKMGKDMFANTIKNKLHFEETLSKNIFQDAGGFMDIFGKAGKKAEEVLGRSFKGIGEEAAAITGGTLGNTNDGVIAKTNSFAGAVKETLGPSGFKLVNARLENTTGDPFIVNRGLDGRGTARGLYQINDKTGFGVVAQMNGWDKNSQQTKDEYYRLMKSTEGQNLVMDKLIALNTQYLQGKGIEANDTNLYLAHLLGGPVGSSVIKDYMSGTSRTFLNQTPLGSNQNQILEGNRLRSTDTISLYNEVKERVFNAGGQVDNQVITRRPGTTLTGVGPVVSAPSSEFKGRSIWSLSQDPKERGNVAAALAAMQPAQPSGVEKFASGVSLGYQGLTSLFGKTMAGEAGSLGGMLQQIAPLKGNPYGQKAISGALQLADLGLSVYQNGLSAGLSNYINGATYGALGQSATGAPSLFSQGASYLSSFIGGGTATGISNAGAAALANAAYAIPVGGEATLLANGAVQLSTQATQGAASGGAVGGLAGASTGIYTAGAGMLGSYLGTLLATEGLGLGYNKQGQTGMAVGGALGALGGLTAGAAIAGGGSIVAGLTAGASAGSVVPVIGTLIGAIIGTVIGALATFLGPSKWQGVKEAWATSMQNLMIGMAAASPNAVSAILNPRTRQSGAMGGFGFIPENRSPNGWYYPQGAGDYQAWDMKQFLEHSNRFRVDGNKQYANAFTTYADALRASGDPAAGTVTGALGGYTGLIGQSSAELNKHKGFQINRLTQLIEYLGLSASRAAMLMRDFVRTTAKTLEDGIADINKELGKKARKPMRGWEFNAVWQGGIGELEYPATTTPFNSGEFAKSQKEVQAYWAAKSKEDRIKYQGVNQSKPNYVAALDPSSRETIQARMNASYKDAFNKNNEAMSGSYQAKAGALLDSFLPLNGSYTGYDIARRGIADKFVSVVRSGMDFNRAIDPNRLDLTSATGINAQLTALDSAGFFTRHAGSKDSLTASLTNADSFKTGINSLASLLAEDIRKGDTTMESATAILNKMVTSAGFMDNKEWKGNWLQGFSSDNFTVQLEEFQRYVEAYEATIKKLVTSVTDMFNTANFESGFEGFKKNLADTYSTSIEEDMVTKLMASSPIAAAMNDIQTNLDSKMADFMSDRVLSVDEANQLAEMVARDFGVASDNIEAMKPVFEQIYDLSRRIGDIFDDITGGKTAAWFSQAAEDVRASVANLISFQTQIGSVRKDSRGQQASLDFYSGQVEYLRGYNPGSNTGAKAAYYEAFSNAAMDKYNAEKSLIERNADIRIEAINRETEAIQRNVELTQRAVDKRAYIWGKELDQMNNWSGVQQRSTGNLQDVKNRLLPKGSTKLGRLGELNAQVTKYKNLMGDQSDPERKAYYANLLLDAASEKFSFASSNLRAPSVEYQQALAEFVQISEEIKSLSQEADPDRMFELQKMMSDDAKRQADLAQSTNDILNGKGDTIWDIQHDTRDKIDALAGKYDELYTLIETGMVASQRELLTYWQDTLNTTEHNILYAPLGSIQADTKLIWEIVRQWGEDHHYVPTDPSTVTGARAAGGSVIGGRKYWVGENGPELFSAGSNGYIYNNKQSMDYATGRQASSIYQSSMNSGDSNITISPKIAIHVGSVNDEAMLNRMVYKAEEVIIRSARSGKISKIIQEKRAR